MKDYAQERLRILGQLAQEYGEKHKELEVIVQNASPQEIAHQFGVRGELTTDRFRGVQQALFEILGQNDGQERREEVFQALAVLSRCFDEMRVLFQVLLEHSMEIET